MSNFKSEAEKARKNTNKWMKNNISSDNGVMTVIMIIISILFPPLSVFLKVGIGLPLLLNIVLTIMWWLPGVVHAIYVLFTEK